MRRNATGDLISARLPTFDENDDLAVICESLFRWVEASALGTLEWYLKEKIPKARKSRFFRILAIVLAAVGSVAPFIAVGTHNSVFALWGYPVLGAAAACVGVDKALGLSSSWMRYQATAASIEKMLMQHQLKWVTVSRALSVQNTRIESFLEAMEEIKCFAEELGEVVIGETRDWTSEFRGHFSRLEAEADRLQL